MFSTTCESITSTASTVEVTVSVMVSSIFSSLDQKREVDFTSAFSTIVSSTMSVDSSGTVIASLSMSLSSCTQMTSTTTLATRGDRSVVPVVEADPLSSFEIPPLAMQGITPYHADTSPSVADMLDSFQHSSNWVMVPTSLM